jgi:hypothetical protein
MLGRDLLAVSFLRWMPQPLLDLRYEPLGGSQIPDGMVIVLRLTAPKNRMMLLSVPLAKGDGSQVCSGLVWGFSCQAVVFGFCSQFFVRSGKGRSSFFNRAAGVKKVLSASGLRRIVVSPLMGRHWRNAFSLFG